MSKTTVYSINDPLPYQKQLAETLYQLNMDEQLRETCERFYKAETRERGFKNNITRLTKENEELITANTELKKSIAEQKAEITRLKALLDSQEPTKRV